MEITMDMTKGCSRDGIKCIAMLTMLLNHIAYTFLDEGTLLYEVFLAAGYFTAPVMCFFLVEGYRYTSSKRNYAIRLGIFALLSQIPFSLVFHLKKLSIFATLFLCFLLLVVKERIQEDMLRFLLIVGIIGVTYFCDWPIFAAVLVLMIAYDEYYPSEQRKRELLKSYIILYLIKSLDRCAFPDGAGLLVYLQIYGIALLKTSGILIAGIVIAYFYNGKRSAIAPRGFKRFFYIFYPAHLFLLYFIKQICF